jgi:hypothetical protein
MSSSAKLSLGKDIVDLHTEFLACKSTGQSKIAIGQKLHPHMFHSDEE